MIKISISTIVRSTKGNIAKYFISFHYNKAGVTSASIKRLISPINNLKTEGLVACLHNHLSEIKYL